MPRILLISAPDSPIAEALYMAAQRAGVAMTHALIIVDYDLNNTPVRLGGRISLRPDGGFALHTLILVVSPIDAPGLESWELVKFLKQQGKPIVGIDKDAKRRGLLVTAGCNCVLGASEFATPLKLIERVANLYGGNPV